MTQKSKKEVLSTQELIAKKKTLVSELVKFRVSMDVASLQTKSNAIQLKRELRAIARDVARSSAQRKVIND
jgi:hypothetical protein